MSATIKSVVINRFIYKISDRKLYLDWTVTITLDPKADISPGTPVPSSLASSVTRNYQLISGTKIEYVDSYKSYVVLQNVNIPIDPKKDPEGFKTALRQQMAAQYSLTADVTSESKSGTISSSGEIVIE